MKFKGNGRVGLFEDSDGILSMPKVQAFAFTICLCIMLMADTFTDNEVSWTSYLIAASGAGVSVVDSINDRRKTIKMKTNEENPS